MNQTTRADSWKGVMGAGAMLLLTAMAGCSEEAKRNAAPTIDEATQSANQIQAQGTVTLHVTARDAESPSLRFAWTASQGTLGPANDAATTSEVTWTAPPCSARGLSQSTVTVTVSDELGKSVSKEFSLTVLRCTVLTMASGGWHSLALFVDHTVWAWGYNAEGELGTQSPAFLSTPTPVPGLERITAIAAGPYHSLALREDGTVWAWGANFEGQLGDGTTTDHAPPAQVSGLSGVTSIAAGLSNSSLALRGDGTVWAWGDNASGQLGDGTTTDRLTPVQVPGLSGVTSVSSGWQHTLALREDGTSGPGATTPPASWAMGRPRPTCPRLRCLA